MYRLMRNYAAKTDHIKRVMHYPSLDGGEVNIGLLSVGVLLNGYSYFIPKLHEHLNIKPLVRHGSQRGAGFRVGRTQGRRYVSFIPKLHRITGASWAVGIRQGCDRGNRGQGVVGVGGVLFSGVLLNSYSYFTQAPQTIGHQTTGASKVCRGTKGLSLAGGCKCCRISACWGRGPIEACNSGSEGCGE